MLFLNYCIFSVSVEALVSVVGNYSIYYSLTFSETRAKHYENPTMLSRVTAKNVGDVFLRHSVVLTSITGKSSIVCFRDSAHRIRRERWIADKVVDMNSHSDDVMAASIILNDIRLTVYDCEQYGPLETTENGDKFIPSSLKRFLRNLLDCKGKSRTVSDRRCTAIVHAIISASRPRSFISPLLLGLSMYVNCKYVSVN